MGVRVYSVNFNGMSVSNAANVTFIQIKAGTNNACELLRVELAQTSTNTNNYIPIQILRKTAAATVTSFTPIPIDPGDAAAGSAGGTSATGVIATAEGTDGSIIVDTAVSVLQPYMWVPTPEERILFRAGGIIAIKTPASPAALTYRGYALFAEAG